MHSNGFKPCAQGLRSSTADPRPWRSTTSLCGIGLGKFRPMWTGSVAFQLVQLHQRTLYCIYRWKMRRRLAAWHRSSTQPHISEVKPCGSYSATAIPTRLAAASALRWPRVAHSAREGVTMAIARKPREPLSPGDRGTLSLWTLWVHSPPTADTSSSLGLWIASRGTLCLYLPAIIRRHGERRSVAPCRAVLRHPSPPLVRPWQGICW